MSRNPNRMQEAVTKLMGRLQTCASVIVSITTSQGLPVASIISATPGRTPYEILDGGVVVPYESHDFTIAVSLMGGAIPTSGWVITDAAGRRYVVSMPGKMNVYESFQGIAYKIHTKAVS